MHSVHCENRSPLPGLDLATKQKLSALGEHFPGHITLYTLQSAWGSLVSLTPCWAETESGGEGENVLRVSIVIPAPVPVLSGAIKDPVWPGSGSLLSLSSPG